MWRPPSTNFFIADLHFYHSWMIMQVFSLLADTLAEIQEQIGGGSDDESEEVPTLHLII